jgi:hypothetical protein
MVSTTKSDELSDTCANRGECRDEEPEPPEASSRKVSHHCKGNGYEAQASEDASTCGFD